MKIIYIPLLLVICIANSSSSSSNDKAVKANSPKNTVIVFDLNDVLVKKDILGISKKVGSLFGKSFFWGKVFSYDFWNKMFTYSKEKHCKEAVYLQMSKDYPELANYENEYIELSTSHKIIPLALDIVKRLKSKGYSLYIFTNMGCKSMDVMVKKFPELFNLFDGYYCPSPDNEYDCKPYESFYIKFKDYLSSKGEAKKKVIFIDDRKKNLKIAKKLGFNTILCNSIKNVERQLIKLGILN